MSVQKWDAAEGLLYVCRKLLSQPYIAPVLSALLYQWLLTHKDAGGFEQRQKHINLLVAGACGVSQLFTWAFSRPFTWPLHLHGYVVAILLSTQPEEAPQ